MADVIKMSKFEDDLKANLNDKEYCKEHTYFRLAPASDIEEGVVGYTSDDTPSIFIEAYINLDHNACTKLTRSLAKNVFGDISDDELHEVIFKNTIRDFKPIKVDLSPYGFSKMSYDIISTEGMLYGAMAIFMGDMLDSYKKDVLVVFTSKHEALVHYRDEDLERVGVFQKSLRDTNAYATGKDNFLSDHVFKYIYEEGRLVEL